MSNWEAKFRGIDNNTNSFVYGHYTTVFGVAEDFDAIIVRKEDGLGIYYIDDRKTISQYILLKDKNGIEIYVSDICRYKDESGNEQIGIVKDIDFFKKYIEDFNENKECNQDIALLDRYDYEVIGNIYENPELLA